MLCSVFYLFRPGMYEAGVIEMLEDFDDFLSMFLPRSLLEWPVGILW